MLRQTADLDVATDPHAGFFQAAEAPYECVIVSTGFAEFDPLRLCSQLRSLDRTRFLPIILSGGCRARTSASSAAWSLASTTI